MGHTTTYSVNGMRFDISSIEDVDAALADVHQKTLAILTNTNLYHQDRMELDALSQAREDLLVIYEEFEQGGGDDLAADVNDYVDMEAIIEQQYEIAKKAHKQQQEQKLSHTIHTKPVVSVNGRVFKRGLPYGDEVIYTEDRPWPQRYEIIFGSKYRDLSERGKSEDFVGVRFSNLDGQPTDCSIQLFMNDNVQWIKGPFFDIESAIKAALIK